MWGQGGRAYECRGIAWWLYWGPGRNLPNWAGLEVLLTSQKLSQRWWKNALGQILSLIRWCGKESNPPPSKYQGTPVNGSKGKNSDYVFRQGLTDHRTPLMVSSMCVIWGPLTQYWPWWCQVGWFWIHTQCLLPKPTGICKSIKLWPFSIPKCCHVVIASCAPSQQS